MSHAYSFPRRRGQQLEVVDGSPAAGGAWPQRSVTTGGVAVRVGWSGVMAN